MEAKPPSAVQATPASAEKVEEGKEENPVATNRKRKYTAAKTVANQRTRRSLRQAVPATKDTSGSNGNEEVTSNATRKDVNSTAEFQDDQPDNGSFEQSDSDCMPEDFNNYLDSLVGNLAYPATGNSLAQEHELGQNQGKLLLFFIWVLVALFFYYLCLCVQWKKNLCQLYHI